MKIKVSRLRHLIREVLEEDMSTAPTERPPGDSPDRPTIPAARSREEQEFSKEMGGRKWGAPPSSSPSSTKMKTPVESKALQIMNIIHQSPQWGDMSSDERKGLHDQVTSHLKSMDPGDLMVATAQQLAKQFMN